MRDCDECCIMGNFQCYADCNAQEESGDVVPRFRVQTTGSSRKLRVHDGLSLNGSLSLIVVLLGQNEKWTNSPPSTIRNSCQQVSTV